jgi:pantoate--beta-alanine ligase
VTQVFSDLATFRAACDSARSTQKSVGFVPTMGALHHGHATLAQTAKSECDWVAVSIFVNPTQFGPNEDFDRYPRTLEADVRILEPMGVDAVFAPSASLVYPLGDQTRVHVGSLAEPFCGGFRPGHFEGVATVVSKLLGIVGKCSAYFGRKDYQQLQIIKRVVTDLFLPVNVVGVPTVREPDGLALSSRNRYLKPEDRQQALSLVRGLRAAFDLFEQGERNVGNLRQASCKLVERDMTKVDYVQLADPDSLEVYQDNQSAGSRLLIAMAAYLGTTRLIDNIVLGEDPRPKESI